MKIAYCTPFKPVDHTTLSGDVTIARDLLHALRQAGHEVVVLPYYPAREIYRRPGDWQAARRALRAMVEAGRGADCWLTYGTYYKVPDVFGPDGARQLGVPYFIYQASYAENRGRKLATWPGFALNRRAMLRADHLFINRANDLCGCSKLLPNSRYTRIRPGLRDGLFARDEPGRERLRRQWNAGDTPVVVTTAMMRRGVKEEGVRWVIESCAELIAQGFDLMLAVAGDGPARPDLEALAARTLGDRARFLGMVDREALPAVYSAGDLFAFPGLKESVGMVYLEAQACRLPVVATDDEGAPFVVAHDATGLVTHPNRTAFTTAMGRLLMDGDERRALAGNAVQYVHENHTFSATTREMLEIMERIIRENMA